MEGNAANTRMQAFEKSRGRKPTKSAELNTYCRAVLMLCSRRRGRGLLISILWVNVSHTASMVAYKEAWISCKGRAESAEPWSADLGCYSDRAPLKMECSAKVFLLCKSQGPDYRSTRPSGFTEVIHLS